MNPSQPSKLDEQLQQIACSDWQAFVKLLGAEVIDRAKVCLLRSNGRTYGEIAAYLDTNRKTVISQVKRSCDCSSK